MVTFPGLAAATTCAAASTGASPTPMVAATASETSIERRRPAIGRLLVRMAGHDGQRAGLSRPRPVLALSDNFIRILPCGTSNTRERADLRASTRDLR